MLPINTQHRPLEMAWALANPGLSEYDRALVLAFNTIAEDLKSLEVPAISDTLKLICGLDHDATQPPAAFAHRVGALQPISTYLGAKLPLARLQLLAGFYLALCQGNAFQPDGLFDAEGLVDFMSHYLRMPRDDVAQGLLGSEVSACLFASMRRYGPQHQQIESPPLCGASAEGIIDTAGNCLPLPPPQYRLLAENGHYRDAYVAKVHFAGLDVKNVHFENVTLTGAHFERLKMQDVRFDNCRLERLHLSGCTATRMHIANGSDADEALFKDSEIIDSNFDQSHFRRIHIKSCKLANLVIVGCTLVGARIQGNENDPMRESVTNMRVRWSNLDGAEIEGIEAYRLTLEHCSLQGARFTRNKLLQFSCESESTARAMEGAQFRENAFKNCKLDNMAAQKTEWYHDLFEECTLREVDFGRSLLHRVRFRSEGFHLANFSGATLRGISFVGGRRLVNLAHTDFRGAKLEDVVFRKCQLQLARFRAGDLSSVLFEDSSMARADLTYARGVDIISAQAPNRLTAIKLTGARGTLSASVLAALRTADGREQMLNRQRYAGSLMARIMMVDEVGIRADWLLSIMSFLQANVPHASDADGSMLKELMLLADHAAPPTIVLRARLESQITCLLQRQLPLLNATGVSSAYGVEWRTSATERLAVMLTELPDIAALRRMSPLTTFLLAQVEHESNSLKPDTAEALRRTRAASVPTTLREAVESETGAPMFEAGGAHGVCFTANGEHAIVIHPQALTHVLGISATTMPAVTPCRVFSAAGDDWVEGGDVRLQQVLSGFPILARARMERAALLTGLVNTLKLPASLRQVFLAGFIERQRHCLIGANDQSFLGHALSQLVAVTENLPLGSSDRTRAAALRPTRAHRAEVEAALALLRRPLLEAPAAARAQAPSTASEAAPIASSDGSMSTFRDIAQSAFAPDAALYMGLGCFLFRAASAALFGAVNESPIAINAYALAWINQACDLDPALQRALVREIAYDDLIERAVGSPRVFLGAGIVADILERVVASPVCESDPNIAQIRATFCR